VLTARGPEEITLVQPVAPALLRATVEPAAEPLPIVLVNLASTAGLGAQLPGALPKLMEAWLESINGIFASYYGGQIRMRVAKAPADRAKDEIAINFRDALPDPEHAALHQVVNGVPDIELGLADFDDLFTGPLAVSVGGDQELKATIRDKGANGWKDRGDGTSEAEDVVDRVQDTLIESSTGVSLANFLLDAAWIPGSPGPWDYDEVLTSQQGLTPGGFVVLAASPTDPPRPSRTAREELARRTVDARLVELTDAQANVHLYALAPFSPRMQTRRSHPWSRVYRRGARLLPQPTAAPAPTGGSSSSSQPAAPSTPAPSGSSSQRS
jgi:hypothetical protein